MISQEDIVRAYDEYAGELLAFILKSEPHYSSAEDILQDVFLKLISYSRGNNIHSVNLRALLYSIARTVCIDAARKRQKLRLDSVDPTVLQDIPDTKEQTEDPLVQFVDEFLIETTEPEKTILELRRRGFTYQEIAGITSLSERTVKRKFKKLLVLMQEAMIKKGML